MKDGDLVPLSKNEIGFMFLLSIFVCFIASVSIVYIINQYPTICLISQTTKRIVVLGQILILCLYIIPISLDNILIYRGVIKDKDDTPYLYRLSRKTIFYSSIIITTLFIGTNSGADVVILEKGLVSGYEYFDSLCYGLIIWFFIGLIYKVIDVYPKRIDKFWNKLEDEICIFVRAKSKKERLLAFLFLPLAVVSEELLYRGYLVLYLGNVYKSYILFGIISVTLSVIVHLYQGKGRIISNIIFAGSMVIISIITSRILISIIIHLLNNYFVVFMRWRISNRRKQSII